MDTQSLLVTTDLQQTNNPLYQLLSQLITDINSLKKSGKSGSSSSSITNINNQLSQLLFNDSDREDGLIIPGPRGSDGFSGISIPGSDGLDGLDSFIPGPQGIQGIPGSAGTSGINLATLNVTDAGFRTLSSVPLTIVPAQGAGTIILPLWVACAYNITVAFSAGATSNVQYAGGISAGSGTFTVNANVLGQRYGNNNELANQTASATSRTNANLVVFNSADVTGGTTNGGFNYYVAYIVVTVP